MAGFYKSYSNSMDLHVPFSRLGAPTNPGVAKQLEEFSKLLNQGMKNIEVGTVPADKFEGIPIQHFDEIRRLAKITDSKPSVHAPLIDLSGFADEGGGRWSEEQRASNEQQVFSILERSHRLGNGENVPVVFHAGKMATHEYGVPYDPVKHPEGLKKEVIDPKTGRVTEVPTQFRSILAVNQDTGELAPLHHEKVYRIGKDKPEIWDTERRLESLNQSKWDDEKLKLLTYQKDIEEIKSSLEIKQQQNEAIEKTNLLTQPGYSKIYENNKRDMLLMSRHIGEINRKLSSSYDDVYDKFKRFASEDTKKEHEEQLEKMNEKFREFNNERRKKLEQNENIQDGFSAARSEEEKERLRGEFHKNQRELLDIGLAQSKLVVTNLANIEPPKIWKDGDTFAKEKATDTVSGAIAKMYKKLQAEGKEAQTPFIALENFFVNTPMSRGKELREAVIMAREKLAKRLADECKLNSKQAAKEAEKLVGATWDVGHINNLRKSGFEGEELKKEVLSDTKQIADLVKHVHITDNFGFFDSHLAPGMGNVPIKEIMEHLEKTWAKEMEAGRLHQAPRGIVEAGGLVGEIGQNPTLSTLEFFGSPLYKMGPGPYWSGDRGVANTYSNYREMSTEFPQQHFNLYGSSFTTLPKAVGGQVGEERSRFAGTPQT